MRTPRRLAVLLVAAAAAVSACGTDEATPATTARADLAPTSAPSSTTTTIAGPTTTTLPPTFGVPVPEALTTDLTGAVTLTGYLVIDQGSPRLCAELLPIDPPACGGMSVSIGGSVDSPLLLDGGTGVRWSAWPVDIVGSFSGSKIFADGPSPQLVPPTTVGDLTTVAP